LLYEKLKKKTVGGSGMVGRTAKGEPNPAKRREKSDR